MHLKMRCPQTSIDMELTIDELTRIKELAGNFLNIEEIALIIEKDPDEFFKEVMKRKTKAWYAYRSGIAESKNQIREREVKMAQHGSPQAVVLVDKYISEQNIFELDD